MKDERRKRIMFGDLIRWNPGEELSNWHRDIDELFGRFFQRPDGSIQSWAPRMETYRKDNYYVVKVDLPGVNPEDVHVETEGNLLTISGERKGEEKGSEYRETFYGKFERQISLPQGIEADKVMASYQHGVLEVRVPLPAQLAGRKVPVQIEDKEEKKLESKAA
jgi:HSP20 family protein